MKTATVKAPVVIAIEIATCIGCACTDDRACTPACHWERIDRAVALGVCSACPDHIARWDAGERKLSRAAAKRRYNRRYYAEHASVWTEKYDKSRKHSKKAAR